MRYRAEQVGSLLRPPELLQARAAFAAGHIDEIELRSREDEAIRLVLGKQRDVGMDVCTDGEFRRGAWLTDMAEAVEGFIPDSMLLEWKGPGGGIEKSTAQTVGAKLREVQKLTGRELPFLQRHAAMPYKITLPAP